METRLIEAENNLRALVADVVGGARVIQGGGNERLESSLPDRVREAAAASLVRLFHKFNDADDHRWPKVIERARAGAEHPLAVLDYSGKTEEHPVCAAVLSFVGAGKRGRDVRSHFSGPPYGWPRDAIDAALISLFGAGHLRATANGVALHPPQLDQAKVPSTDFRTESATINARQRLKLRSLFQTAGVDCKPNEEIAAAGRLLTRLGDLALNAGGDAPLPKRPDTQHLSELLALSGNEQLLAISGPTRCTRRQPQRVDRGENARRGTSACIPTTGGARPTREWPGCGDGMWRLKWKQSWPTVACSTRRTRCRGSRRS